MDYGAESTIISQCETWFKRITETAMAWKEELL